jgi:hypothetical protein
MTHDQQPETPQPKLEWVKPEVQRLEAGSAELNSTSRINDAMFNFS